MFSKNFWKQPDCKRDIEIVAERQQLTRILIVGCSMAKF